MYVRIVFAVLDRLCRLLWLLTVLFRNCSTRAAAITIALTVISVVILLRIAHLST